MSRRDGTSRFYGLAMQVLDPGAQRLWPLIREQIATLETIESGHQSDGTSGDFSASVRELRLAQTRTALDWLRSLL